MYLWFLLDDQTMIFPGLSKSSMFVILSLGLTTSTVNSFVGDIRVSRNASLLKLLRKSNILDNDGNDEGTNDDNAMLSAASNRRNFFTKSMSIVSTAMAGAGLFPGPQQQAFAAVGAAAPVIETPSFTKEVTWPIGKVAFSLLPLAGTSTRRATVEECIIPDTMWTHDQIQGVVNVNVPVRQTVVKLSEASGGGLWVHNPIAPTPQLVKMMRQLEAKYGPVKHIVLGSVALEHKATLGPFAQYFPDATVWIQPGQWSFPVQLPIQFLGVQQSGSKLREIPYESASSSKIKKNSTKSKKENVVASAPEWMGDFDYEVLDPLRFRSVGAFSETAFFHKSSKTLIVTDSVVSVTAEPPKIIQEDPRAMLFHARDSIDEVVEDTPAMRRKGWRRMVQFGLVFFPSQIDVVPFAEAISEAKNINPSMKTLGEGAVPFSLYPWKWHDNDVDLKNFEAISKGGKLFCPPILTKLILDREPSRTIEWVERVSSRFDFKRIIPGHLTNNVKASPKEFSAAFDVLRNDPMRKKVVDQRALAEDLALLQKASDLLTKFGVVAQSQVCDLEPARTVGRFASTKL